VFQQDPRIAARERDLGLRKIGRTTWRAGLVAAACSAVIGLALGQHAPAAASSSGGAVGGSSSTSNPASGSATHAPDDQGSIVIPALPPQPAAGAAHVASGGS